MIPKKHISEAKIPELRAPKKPKRGDRPRVNCMHSHNHKFRGPPLWVSTAGAERGRLLRGALGVAERVLLAQDAVVPFVEIVAEDEVALLAGEAEWMILLPLIRLKVLPFDAAVAVGAERTVLLMVVPSTVRVVVVHVEVGGLEGGAARLADKALLVVTTGELSICRTDRLAVYGCIAPSAWTFACARSFSRGRLWDRGWRREAWRQPNISRKIHKR